MKKFNYINATTIAEAVSALGEGGAAVLAGGTDILTYLKGYVSPNAPQTLVNIKNIPGMDDIKEEGGMLKIGALAKLKDVYTSATVQANYAALAEAAHKVGTPELRNMGTIGGNICQMVRCWYYRSEHNTFDCLRKNPTGGVCQALLGDNRYHSIFGAMSGCVAVNPSDIAPALVALGATIVYQSPTETKSKAAEEFFTMNGEKTTVLGENEIVTEIQVPEFSGKSAFLKFAIRKSFDFPIVNCAAVVSDSEARICLNGVYNTPKLFAPVIPLPPPGDIAEDLLADASALPHNGYMIQIAKTLVKRAVLACS